jgi:endonuclease/exonuclease/phosphatase family metal-dependent hydrolase
MKHLISLLLMLLVAIPASGQKKPTSTDKTVFIAWWNLENLFDTIDDDYSGDDEFTPVGKKRWTEERLDAKLANLAQAIRSMNNGDGPDVLGFCEVEHQNVIDRLLAKHLKDNRYKILYRESPDERGIDVAMIYKSPVTVSAKAFHEVVMQGRPTREIIEAETNVYGNKLTLLLNHWPSRLGGKETSEPRRLMAAKVARQVIDSLLARDSNADILLMGDFNDEPTDKSLTDVLQATGNLSDAAAKNSSKLFNAMADFKKQGRGTFKYRREWDMIDQFVLSHGLVAEKPLVWDAASVAIYDPPFLHDDRKSRTDAPKPTFSGNKYIGGYSDHFPIVMKLKIVKN